ncbi:MobF family relaxase [Pseudonocardia sp. Ae717_Ps2]|uniref:MobF family relaxase n=1 Tax=Pseudonocardia sp. Ae717_Ps2 TaxID=1885573 RepID=UPI001300D786|nr:MobF family relaxase [Pseudonocardia sp. Ae717_Ps2]
MLRITAISAGAVEYLIRGSGCTDHEHVQDLDRTAGNGGGHSAERAAAVGAERDGQGPAYFDAAVVHGEPQGYWFGSGLEAMGLAARSGDVADPDDVRAVFGQLRRPESTEEAPEFLGRRPPTYRTAEQRYQALAAKEPGGLVTPERERELREQSVTDGRKGVAYYDFTFSAPKSVSVYYAALLAAGAEGEAAAVRGAHERAVEIAVSYGEQYLAQTRTGWHGRTTSGNESVGKHEAGRGTVWTLWGHSTSRENEPQLHTHGGLLNRTTTADGKVRALDGSAFRGVKEAIATAYERALEQLTTEATGARFALRPDGVAREIVGVDPELMAEASTRRGQVTARVEELAAEYRSRHGREPDAAARKAMADMATLDTRKAKGAEAGPAAVAAWGAERVERLVDMLDEVEAHGHQLGPDGRPVTGPDVASGASGHAATAQRTGQQLGTGPDMTGQAVGPVAGLDREAVMAAAVEDVQAQYAVWTMGNLALALDRRLGGAHELGVDAAVRPALLEELTREALHRSNVVLVSAPDPVIVPGELRRPDGGSIYRRANGQRYATAEHLATEDRVLAQAGAELGLAVDGPQLEMLRVELQAAGLSGDQVDAVAGIVSSGRVGDVLVGPAGAGKSRTVGQLATVWTGQTGGRVIGVATSQIATQNLAGDGLEAINSTRFLHAFSPDPVTGQSRDRLAAGDMVVIDEAGMSSTRDLSEITALCAAAGAKVVYTGDQQQLDAVEAGGLFAHLVRTGPHHELTEVHRFLEPWEAEASLQLRAGDQAAVDAYGDRGRLRTGTVEEMQEQAARAYLADTVAGRSSLLIVGTNDHANELSRRVRDELVELGHVGEQHVAVAGRYRQLVSVGDRVQALMNNYDLRVDPAAGQAGPVEPVMRRAIYTVTGVDQHTGDLLATDRHGATVHLPPDYVREHLNLAYAVTVHSAQGVTVDSGYPIVDRDWARENLYPAATRGRARNVLHLVTERAPDVHEPERLDESARERLAAVLATSSAQQAASHVRERGVADAESFLVAAADWDTVAGQYARGRYEATLVEVLGPQQVEQLRQESGYGRLLRAVREAEMAGHNAEAVLVEAVTERGFAGADSVSDVVRWRLRTNTAAREPEQAVDPRDWTTLAAPLDGEVGEYAQALAVLATDRQDVLGRQVAEQSPEWATAHLGPVPDAVEAAAERAEWERRAGIAAAYRELHRVPDEQVSLGAAPSREYEFHRALWSHARAALGQPVDVSDPEAADDGELYAATERWVREQQAAPPWVAEELAEAHRSLHEHQITFQLAAAELERMPRNDQRWGSVVARLGEERDLVDAHADRVDWLEYEHELRGEWAARTRTAAQEARLAAEELGRRGLPLERAGGPDEPGPEQRGADPEHDTHYEADSHEDDRDPAEPVEVSAGDLVDDLDAGASAGGTEPHPEPAEPHVGVEVAGPELDSERDDVAPGASAGSTPAPEPVVDEAPEPVVDEAPEPVVDEAPEPVVDEAPEPVVDEAPEPVVDEAPEPVVSDLQQVAEASRDHDARERGRQAERDRAAERERAAQAEQDAADAQAARSSLDHQAERSTGHDVGRGRAADAGHDAGVDWSGDPGIAY